MYDLEDKVLQLTWEWQLSYLMSQREPGLASQDKAENQKDSHGGRQGSLHPIPRMAQTWVPCPGPWVKTELTESQTPILGHVTEPYGLNACMICSVGILYGNPEANLKTCPRLANPVDSRERQP